MESNTEKEVPFIGAVRDPFCSPKVTGGFVGFKVRQIQGRQLLNNAAQLVSESGEIYPITVRGIGRMNAPASDSWQLGDFLVRVDGIDLEKAREMQWIVQEQNNAAPFPNALMYATNPNIQQRHG